MPEVKDSIGKLRDLRRDRYRFTAADVNFIREAYLLEKRRLADILAELPRRCGENMLWQIAVGRAYKHVPLSDRLLEALGAMERGERVPANTKGAAVSTAPVRGEELLAEDGEEEAGESWA